ncbi:MAG TPA: FusB/FusC family EF-G-binding protein [Staphylococcus sp.]|nr:FusB/FusC family EF-G-binding protein [Staphylococcus sp.]
MKPYIYPYQYNYIESCVLRLKNVYKSVNDFDTIKIVQINTREDIIATFNEIDDNILNSLDKMMDIRLSNRQIEFILNTFVNYVIPFEIPSNKKIEKTFRKVKKIKIPTINDKSLYTSSFIGWNDISSNRKYIIYYDKNNQLQGFFGDISTQIVKGFCSICNNESNVALFMKKTSSSSDGRYTKKGDYICYDSSRCNKQLTDLNYFYQFINKIT